MLSSVIVVYLALGAILLLMWWQRRGCSFADLLARDLALHHRVHDVIARHPRGGSWREHQAWMREAG